MERAEPVVRLRGVAVGPAPGKPLLEKVDLDVAPGSIVAVVGPTGAGKSTLLRMLGLRRAPLAGDYLFAGQAVTDVDAEGKARLRRRLGLALPDLPWLDQASLRDNLALPLVVQDYPSAETRSIVAEFVTWLGLGDRADVALRDLSAGERRLVGLARAAVTRPDLLLADEPLAELDGATARKVVRLVQELAQLGSAVVVASAEPALAARFGGETWRIDDRRLRPADAAALRLVG
ncbi:MAG: ATP-binding cassette domain-containing protein [Pseudomonadota bacterium]